MNEFGVVAPWVVVAEPRRELKVQKLVQYGLHFDWVDDESDVSDERLMKVQFESQSDYVRERWPPSGVRVVVPDVRRDFSFAIVAAQ